MHSLVSHVNLGHNLELKPGGNRGPTMALAELARSYT